MNIILKPEMYRIKNGFAAHSKEIGLTAHGITPEIARRNLETTAVMFLRPFEREGQLREVVQRLKLRTDKTEGELSAVAE